MNPASAIGVAAAVIAFLDFSVETLSLCRELRDSTTGALPENLDIERRAKTLQRLTKDLKLPSSVPSVSDKRIMYLGQKCAALTEELQSMLNDIKVNGKGYSQTLKVAMRIIRNKRTIEKLENKICEYQKLLDSSFLVDIR